MTTIYSTNIEEMTKNANGIKEVLLASLANEGYLTKEKADEFASQYAVIIYENGFFGSLIQKLLGDSDKPRVRVVKL